MMSRFAVCILSVGVASAARMAVDKHDAEALQLPSSLLRNTEKQPHIVYVLADDLGRANVGFAAKDIAIETGEGMFEAEVADFTPTLDALADDGIKLDRHYSFTSCTPSRASFMSGRLPVHLGQELGEMETWDGGTDPVWGYEGMPLNITTIGAKLKAVGYKTHLIGKADGFGGATPDHLPAARGFDTSLFYYSHANHNYQYVLDQNAGRSNCESETDQDTPFYDLFTGNGPKTEAATYAAQGKNEDDMFRDHAIDIIANHDSQDPLFLVFTPHTPHTNLDNPEESFAWTASAMCSYNPQCLDSAGSCSFFTDTDPVGSCALKERVDLLSSMHYLDELINSLKEALQTAGMWDDTLFIFASDNGGGIGMGIGGSNFPLKGSKGGDWEGGFRTPAFVSGGNLNQRLRGTSVDGVMHITDWYATFCNLAGAPVEDISGVQAGVPPVDSMDMESMLVGGGDIREELQLSDAALLKHMAGKWYKIVTGTVGNTMHQGPDYPNSTCPRGILEGCRPANPAPIGPQSLPYECGDGCMYDIFADPGERNNLNQSLPELFQSLVDRVEYLNTPSHNNPGYIEPWRGCELTDLLCEVAEQQWQFHYGPIMNIEGCDTCIHTTDEYWANPSIPATTNECQCITSAVQCALHGECSWSRGSCDLTEELQEEERRRGRGGRLIKQRRLLPDSMNNKGSLL